MRITDFEIYRNLLLRASGLSLPEEKSSLLDTRLTPVAQKWGYPTLNAMTLSLRGILDNALLDDIIEAMSNTETSFFYDTPLFPVLRDVLVPHIIKDKGRQKHLRIWSAGCSTGQEAYSVAMALKSIESSLKGWRIEIIGTDLSSNAVRKATAGAYTQFEVQRGLPVSALMTHFQDRDASWYLNDSIRGLVTFDRMNLIDPFEDLGLFDIILCRNVLSHFNPETRDGVLNRLADQLGENGFLILGDGERLNHSPAPFQPLGIIPGLYGHESGRYRLEQVRG